MTSVNSINYLDIHLEKESKILQFHMDLAASIQKVTEDIVLSLARTMKTVKKIFV